MWVSMCVLCEIERVCREEEDKRARDGPGEGERNDRATREKKEGGTGPEKRRLEGWKMAGKWAGREY